MILAMVSGCYKSTWATPALTPPQDTGRLQGKSTGNGIKGYGQNNFTLLADK
jgi:hypothetical protein